MRYRAKSQSFCVECPVNRYHWTFICTCLRLHSLHQVYALRCEKIPDGAVTEAPQRREFRGKKQFGMYISLYYIGSFFIYKICQLTEVSFEGEIVVSYHFVSCILIDD